MLDSKICGNCSRYKRGSAWSGTCSADGGPSNPGLYCRIDKFEGLPSDTGAIVKAGPGKQSSPNDGEMLDWLQAYGYEIYNMEVNGEEHFVVLWNRNQKQSRTRGSGLRDAISKAMEESKTLPR